MQSSKKLPNKSKKASIQCLPALTARVSGSEHYLGLADPEKGESVVADLVYDLASVSKVVGVATICAFVCERGACSIVL